MFLLLQQTEVDKLRSDLHQKEMELVRASQASTFSDLSDTDGGIPAASESFTEKVRVTLTAPFSLVCLWEFLWDGVGGNVIHSLLSKTKHMKMMVC